MKTTFAIGTKVQWSDKKESGSGLVRDDLGQETVMVNANILNGESCNKIRLVKRNILEVVNNNKKEIKMEKNDVKLMLLQAKWKKYGTAQLVGKLNSDNVSEEEKQVIRDLLKARKVEGFTEEERKPEEVENSSVDNQEIDPVVDAEEPQEPIVKKPMKIERKKSGNSSVVEFEDESDEKLPVEENPKKTSSVKSDKKKNQPKISKKLVVRSISKSGKEIVLFEDGKEVLRKLSDIAIPQSIVKGDTVKVVKGESIIEGSVSSIFNGIYEKDIVIVVKQKDGKSKWIMQKLIKSISYV